MKHLYNHSYHSSVPVGVLPFLVALVGCGSGHGWHPAPYPPLERPPEGVSEGAHQGERDDAAVRTPAHEACHTHCP